MPKRRLLIAGAFLVLVIVAGVVFLQVRKDTSHPEASTGSTSTLSRENVELLQKLNSSDEAEQLQALVPALRENEGIKAQLRTGGAKVQILPETFRMYDLHATVNAQLSGNGTVTVTYILQPSDGQWRIVTQQKR